MKIPRNPGNSESDIIQNRFTAYAKAAMYHYRERYLEQRTRKLLHEISYEEKQPILGNLPSKEQMDTGGFLSCENDALCRVLESLREKDRIILIRHTVNAETLTEIAADLQMPYVTVKTIYKRSKEKILKEMKNK